MQDLGVSKRVSGCLRCFSDRLLTFCRTTSSIANDRSLVRLSFPGADKLRWYGYIREPESDSERLASEARLKEDTRSHEEASDSPI
jgi:hypothetical protein